MDANAARVDLGLLSRLSDLILCSRCLRRGRRTRVAQVISHRHRPRSLCAACRAEVQAGSGLDKYP